MSGRDSARGRQLARLVLVLLVVAAGVALATAWREPVLGIYVRPERLEALIRGLGVAGPVAIIVLQALQVILAPVPGQVLGLVSGYLYGPWLGSLFSMAGILLGTSVVLPIVRRWGRPLVERLVDPARLARLDRALGRVGAPLLFLLFLLPLLPDDTILLVAGLSRIPLGGIVLAALLGRLPGVIVLSWLGAGATELTFREWAIVSGATLLVAAPIFYWRASLEQFMWSCVARLTGRPKGDVSE